MNPRLAEKFLHGRACEIALLVALLFAGACERAPTPIESFEPITHVHAMLVAGAESASVFITRSAPGRLVEDWQFQITAVPVHDAVVSLRHDGATFTLAESRADTTSCLARNPYAAPLLSEPGGCYTARIEGGITQGATYDLEIALPDGVVVRGSTTVPGIPVITAPAAGGVIDISGDAALLKVEWTADRPAFGVEAAVSINDQCPVLRERVLQKIRSGAGSILVRNRYYSLCSTTPEDQSQLVLALYDSAYAAYRAALARSRHSIRETRTASGLTGAAGVFGSISVAFLPVTVCRSSGC